MRGVHLIVCTPGRMNDFLTMKSFKTGKPPVRHPSLCVLRKGTAAC